MEPGPSKSKSRPAFAKETLTDVGVVVTSGNNTYTLSWSGHGGDSTNELIKDAERYDFGKQLSSRDSTNEFTQGAVAKDSEKLPQDT